ncbi:MAG: hypothetical protein PWQ79_908 [Thermococcaceae archaeon]|nr:hypothetical protein [Thermococcaceae archaeon]
MEWEVSLIKMAPADFLAEAISELLRKSGFSEVGREYKKKEGVSLVLVTGERENPFSGKERLTVGILRGEAEVEWLKSQLDKYDNLVIVPLESPLSLEGVRVIPPEWLVETFSKYEVSVPRTLVEKFLPPGETTSIELKKFVLDGPFIDEVSPGKLVEDAKRLLMYKYGLAPEEVTIEGLKLHLKAVYAVVLSRENGTVMRALVDDRGVTLEPQGKLRGLVMRILLEDVSTVPATEVLVEDGRDAGAEAIEEAARRGILDVRVGGVRHAYALKGAEVSFRVGSNSGKVTFDLAGGLVKTDMKPLSEEVLREIATNSMVELTGEEPSEVSMARKGTKWFLVRGRTERHLFEFEINAYSGRIKRKSVSLNEEAILREIHMKYPDARILGARKGPETVTVDLVVNGMVKTLTLNLATGEIIEERELASPVRIIFERMGEIGRLLDEGDLELRECRVVDHKIVEAEVTAPGLRAFLRYDSKSGEVLDYKMEIGREIATSLALMHYPGSKIVFAEDSGESYLITLERERDIVKVLVTRYCSLTEIDRYLKESVVEEIALQEIEKIDPSPLVEGLRLSENWEVEFSGSRTFGRLLIHRSSGEVLSMVYQYTESAISKMFEEFVKEEYGEDISVEWVAHNIEEGIVAIKGVGNKNTYFGKYEAHTGKLLEHDVVPSEGIASKLKMSQVAGKYVVK